MRILLFFEISNFRLGAILKFSDAQSGAKNSKIALSLNNAILETCWTRGQPSFGRLLPSNNDVLAMAFVKGGSATSLTTLRP